MERTVPSNCLGNTISTRCIVYEGPSFPDLDIKSGDSLDWVIAQIASSLAIQSVNTSESYDLSCLESTTISPCGALVTYRNFTINRSSATGGIRIEWDIDSIESSLPTSQNVKAAQIFIFGKDGNTYFSSGQPSGITTIPLKAFPITFDMRLFIYSDCGTLQLAGAYQIDANPGEVINTLNLIDSPTSASVVSNSKDAIELLAREVCNIKNNT